MNTNAACPALLTTSLLNWPSLRPAVPFGVESQRPRTLPCIIDGNYTRVDRERMLAVKPSDALTDHLLNQEDCAFCSDDP